MIAPHELRQEFDDRGNHRLIGPNGETTRWASYRSFTYLNGHVGVTDYYTGEGEKILTPDEFCANSGATVEDLEDCAGAPDKNLKG